MLRRKTAEVQRAPEERGRILVRRPLDRTGVQVEVRGDHQHEDHAFDRHHADDAAPGQALRAEEDGWQLRYIEDCAVLLARPYLPRAATIRRLLLRPEPADHGDGDRDRPIGDAPRGEDADDKCGRGGDRREERPDRRPGKLVLAFRLGIQRACGEHAASVVIQTNNDRLIGRRIPQRFAAIDRGQMQEVVLRRRRAGRPLQACPPAMDSALPARPGAESGTRST